ADGARIRPLNEVQAIGPAVTPGHRYRVAYAVVDPDDYRRTVGTGSLEAKVVVLAAGAVGTPVILQRSAPMLGGVPAAVGRYFSGNVDYVYFVVDDDDKVRTVLGLERAPGVGYGALPIGKPINTISFDRLDPQAAEFTRFSLQQIYFPAITNILAQVAGADGDPAWFGVAKKAMRRRWASWLTLLAMTEDDNEGVFGPPP